MEFGTHLTALTSLVDLMTTAEEYGLALDERNRTVCFQGHDTDTPTLRFDADTQSFACEHPDCRFHGGVLDLIQAMEDCSLIEAVTMLAERVGMTPWPEDRSEGPLGAPTEVLSQVRACMRRAAQFYARRIGDAIPFLENRGISRRTAETHLIGASEGPRDLRRFLEEHGFDVRIMTGAGLLNQYGDDFFQRRIIVPLRINGTVIGFYGRAIDEDAAVKHLRMKNERVKLGDAPFNWNSRREEIIVTEGIFDALALIERGFSEAVAVLGTNGLTAPENMRLIKESAVKRVTLCYDGDEAGRRAAIKDGYALEDEGLHVRIVDLGDVDPNEFCMNHDRVEILALIEDAVSPVMCEIGRIQPEWSSERKIAELDGALRRVRTMRPLEQAAVIDRIADLGFSKKAIREQIAALPPEDDEPDLIDLTDCRPVHPALDGVNGSTLMTVPQLVRNPETKNAEWRPWIVTSDREFFPVEPEELRKRGYFAASAVSADEPRYSQRVLIDFLEESRTGDLPSVFHSIEALLREYVDFPDETTFTYLTAWIIGTYFHPLFNYYPYLHFTGTKNVGKSKTMKLMACLCFNGVMSVSVTTASQFRIIEALRPTLFLDESEDLNDKAFSDKRALLLGGYEAGSSVLRTEKEKDHYRVKRLGNYSPRAFASIEGLEDTLASRTVQIQMERSYNETIKQREINLRDPVFQQLRDELFLVTMTYGALIREIYEFMPKPDALEFGDREYNLFKPVLAVGHATQNKDVVGALINFANAAYRRKVVQYNETAEENVLLQYLLERVGRDDWYRADELHAGFIDFIKTRGLEMHRRITKARLGTLLKKLALVSKNGRSPDRTTSMYFIKTEDVRKVARNYLAE